MWNAFVGEVSVYEQETQIMATGFIQGQRTYIAMIVSCIVATNQGGIVFMVRCLTKLIPYTMKVSRQKRFAVFMLFYMSVKLFHMKVQDGAVQIWIEEKV